MADDHEMSNIHKRPPAYAEDVVSPDDVSTTVTTEVKAVKLKRNIGLISGTSFIVGSVIGSGIFISPKGVLTETGSVGMSLVVWSGSGIISLLGALSYAELGTLVPKSGGEYHYFLEAYHPVAAYMVAWTKIIVLQTSTLAIICLVFAEYVASFFDHCGTPQVPVKLVAAAAIVTIGIINSISTKLAEQVQVLFTIVKLLALGIIIVGGIVRLGQGHVETLQTGFEGTTKSPSSVAFAFYDAMWAYDGWNTLNFLLEELKNPYRNLPIANIVGVLLVTVVYVLANISYFTVLSAEGLLDSSAVAVDWGKAVLGDAWMIMPICVLFSTFGAANGSCFASGRVVYAAAREQHLPEVLSYVHCKRYTPLPSIVFTCIIAVLMIIPGDIGGLIDFFSFAAWLFYGLGVACLLVLRFKLKDEYRPIRIPVLIPIVFVLCSIYLVIAPIIQDPRIEFLYAFLFMVGGLLFYFIFVVFKLDRGCFDFATTALQLLCEVAPSPYIPENLQIAS